MMVEAAPAVTPCIPRARRPQRGRLARPSNRSLRLAAVCAQVPAIVARSLQGGCSGPKALSQLAQMVEDDQEEAEGLR